MKILITGANGQLAAEFRKSLAESHFRLTALDRSQLDIADVNSVRGTLSSHKPDAVINCASYNFVDKAEDDYQSAFTTNAEGVKNLASECRKNGTLLVHYSTDYVFDGKKEDFYTEEDNPAPINKYGLSKLEGERFLQEETDNFLLFRVSWVFGEGPQNFLYKLSGWARDKKILRVVCDQVSVPTYAGDIVNVTMFALGKDLKGVYHLTNSGYASRYEVARYYLEKLGLDNLVLPVTSEFFPTAAKRPYFSALSNQKLSQTLNIEIPDWRVGIDRYIEESMTGTQV
ncbi:MAG: dTDP-4-dehydrorhamnose reductase [Nitrospirota bacterium]